MSDIKECRVLVTGANGFVGSRICRRLIADGYQVFAGIREGCDGTYIENLDLQVRFGDVTYPQMIPEMISGIDVIVHNAGLVKADKPEEFFQVNEKGTENILRIAIANKKIIKFILISSLAAAGPSKKGAPLTETDPPHPISEYGRSKLAAEEIVKKYSDEIKTIILRPSAVYGPGDKEMYSFFQTLNNRLKPYLGNPARRMQLIHVDDLALAVSRAITAATASGAVYFVAEPNSYSYYQLVKHLRTAVGRAAVPLYFPGWGLKLIAVMTEKIMKAFGKTAMLTTEKAAELLANWEVSTDRARDDLGFTARYDFPAGARETAVWYREEGWL